MRGRTQRTTQLHCIDGDVPPGLDYLGTARQKRQLELGMLQYAEVGQLHLSSEDHQQ